MRSLALLLSYAAVAILGTYLTFRPTFDTGFEWVQTELGDGMLNHYILENSWLALTDPNYCGSFLSPPAFYPEKWTIYYSENLWGVAPLYWFLRLFLPDELAFPWWQILLNLLNFVTFALAARWLRWPHILALGGAFMWAFALVHVDQIKHQQMIGRCWMPLAAYYAIALVTAPGARSFNRLLGCVFFQCLSCVYTGWFLAVGVATFVPILALLRPGAVRELAALVREKKWQLFRILAFWGLAMAALFVPYLLANWGIARSFEDSYNLTPTPSAWITGMPGAFWNEATAPYREPVSLECWLFCGFTVYALMAAALVSAFAYRRAAGGPEWAISAAAISTAVLWMLLTTAPQEHGESLWRVARYIPGGAAIRVVSRVYLVVYLFGLIAGLTWLAQVTQRIRAAWLRYAVQGALVGAMILEQTGHDAMCFKRRDFYSLVDDVARQMKGAEVADVVPRYVLPGGKVGLGPYGEVLGMWAGLRANVPVIGGYSGREPKGYDMFGARADGQRLEWLKGKYRGRLRVIDPVEPAKYRELVVE